MLTSSLVTAVTDAEEATPENQAARDRNDYCQGCPACSRDWLFSNVLAESPFCYARVTAERERAAARARQENARAPAPDRTA